MPPAAGLVVQIYTQFPGPVFDWRLSVAVAANNQVSNPEGFCKGRTAA
jgi:hypothetical protein